MFLTYCAYGALIICLTGTAYRIGRWFTADLGPEARAASRPQRFGQALKAVAGTLLLPRRTVRLSGVFILEILLQRHILRQSRLRWFMHMALFYGMLFLLFMHTFDDQITARLFDDYASTLNPFLFLRNLLGILLLAGTAIAWRRRRRTPGLGDYTRPGDRWILILLAAIVLSGIALEAVQIISPAMFDQMVVDYMGSDDPEEILPLKSYWADRFDVAFTPMPPASDTDLLSEGEALHESYCAACHSRPTSAVLSYPLALGIKRWAGVISRLDLETRLWYAHYLISCLALALLPFTKLLHLFTVPVSLLARAIGRTADNASSTRPVRRAMGLDACTHCGVCTAHCAVAPIHQVIANCDILPSEKIHSTSAMVFARPSTDLLARLAEGNGICTSCGRCTRYCPSGIDLKDLWDSTRDDLNFKGYLQPSARMTRRTAAEWADLLAVRPDDSAARTPLRQPAVRLADNPDTFRACVQCSTCTNVCPVVAVCDDPQKELDMTPQQIMNLLRLQKKESAMGSRMVWHCVTCYKCQEHCPQGVRVADILYELRNEVSRRLTSAHPQMANLPDIGVGRKI